MSTIAVRSRAEIAQRAAADLPEGSYVNLGIGIPTLVANYVPAGHEVVFHSENGILGVGPRPPDDQVDADLINASKEPISLLPGASISSHADSFVMIRGGHIDISVMGAFQVSCRGDLANWSTGGQGVPGVGGAMDLGFGAKEVWVLTSHQTSKGEAKLLEACTYPLTSFGTVSRVYTDLGVIAVRNGEFVALEIVDGLDLEELQARTGGPLREPADGEVF